MTLSHEALQAIRTAQRNEITEYHLYRMLARRMPEGDNRRLLEHIADDEQRHYHFWKRYSNEDVAPRRMAMQRYYWLARIFGLTFAVKLMERGEVSAQMRYAQIADMTQIDRSIIADEERHEQQLIGLIDEERLKYVGSMILGLNDALVELTGALAGFTLTLQRTNLIAAVGLITGIAAALSMAVSEYLSTKAESVERHPLKASLYTGTTYLATVVILIAPYFLFSSVFIALGISIGAALLIIALFNFYVSVANDHSFTRRFGEMAGLSLGVAAITFAIGFVMQNVFHISV